ncbi:hypothetical protein FMUND_12689 [Fusarium mundagurra]|uniref:Uncharacterized protein n=1 Tax=Fusarium mundagurra TaxID=1567541 RepID=A0A8H5Y2T2_9HYPO|nr:hypothetical protein FMUND_12689 [Fusarium mundagurra]
MESFFHMVVRLQDGAQSLRKDLKSRDVDQVTELVTQVMKDMKNIETALEYPSTDPGTLQERQKLLQMLDFDAKLTYSEMNRDEAFEYPWMTTNNCQERFETLYQSIEGFCHHVSRTEPSMSACILPFTKLVAMFRGTVMGYLKLRRRRIAMQLDGTDKDEAEFPEAQHLDKEEMLSYVTRSFSMEFISNCLRQYFHDTIDREAISVKLTWDSDKGQWTATKGQWADAAVAELDSGAIEVIMIEPTKLLNSPYTASQQYDERNDIPCHPMLQRCKLDFLDREEGALHWSLGGVVAWRFYGEYVWMDRFGHVIELSLYTIANRQLR